MTLGVVLEPESSDESQAPKKAKQVKTQNNFFIDFSLKSLIGEKI
jgi:hypothetical protein